MSRHPMRAFTSANLAGLSLVLAPTPVFASNLLDAAATPAELPAPVLQKSSKSDVSPEANLGSPKRTFLRHLTDQISSYSQLQDGWDGPDSVRPSDGAVRASLAFVSTLSPSIPMPEVTAAGDGEISLSWRDDQKFIDISFYGHEGTAYVRIDNRIEKIRALRSFWELPSEAVEALVVA